MLALVWDANPGLTLALAVLNLLQGGLPAAARLDLQAAHRRRRRARSPRRGTAALPQVLLLVALQFAIGAAGNVLGTLSNICQQLLQEQVANRIQLLVMRQANQLDLVFFERPQFYDLLQQVQREATYRPVSDGPDGLRADPPGPDVRVAAGAAGQPGVVHRRGRADLAHPGVHLERALRLAGLPDDALAVAAAAHDDLPDQPDDHRHRTTRKSSCSPSATSSSSASRASSSATTPRSAALVIRRYLAGAAWSMLTVLTSGLTFFYVAYRTLRRRDQRGRPDAVRAGRRRRLAGLLGACSAGCSRCTSTSSTSRRCSSCSTSSRWCARPSIPMPVRHPIAGGHRVPQRQLHLRRQGRAGAQRRQLHDRAEARRWRSSATTARARRRWSSCVARLYDPQAGQVLIDGRDVREYDPDELRGEFGVLFQDYVSYQFSARENIGIGRVERLDDTPAIADGGRQERRRRRSSRRCPRATTRCSASGSTAAST